MTKRGVVGVVLAVLALVAGGVARVESQAPGRTAEARDMRLVGHHDLQARSAYQPLVHQQGGRFIAYVGHHGGRRMNPLTGAVELNGTSILDVTDPAHPQYLAHIPGAPGEAEAGGASMVRVCDGRTLPRADRARTYLLRTMGNVAHEIWDVSDPARPARTTVVVSGLDSTHKNWWECDTGIAYLVSDGRPQGWRSNRITKIYDLGDPAHPRFIRDFGLPGQEPGSTTTPVPEGTHGPIAYRDRVYFPYGTGARGILQIVDRKKLLEGDPAPTVANLLAPQIGRIDMPPDWGGHTSFPLLGLRVPPFAGFARGAVRDFVFLVSESLRNECQEAPQFAFVVDVTDPARPFPVSSYMAPVSAQEFCSRGGRFGTHSSHESFTPRYYGKLMFLAYFNAGVRAVDVRDPFHPREVASFIPAVTDKTDKRCVTVGGVERCKVAIQTNNVEVDDRGLVYLADRADTGLHIVELTGAARDVAGLTWTMPNEYPATSIPGEGDQHFARALRERSQGRIEIVHRFDASAGYRSRDLLQAIGSGAVPIGDTYMGALGDIDPIFLLPSLPFVSTTPDEARRLEAIARPYYERALARHNQKLLYTSPWPAAGLWAKTPVDSVAALRGLRIRTADANGVVTFKAAGAAPVQISFADALPRIKAGTIDAVLSSGDGGAGARLWEMLDHFTAIDYGMTMSMVTVNLDAWNALPPDLKTAVTEAASAASQRQWTEIGTRVSANYARMKANGVTITTTLPDAYRAALRTAGQAAVDDWTARMGADGAAILAAYRKGPR
jgi:TRAP-type C4-dicarboxylate transport system substrate-binding protein